MNRSARKSAFAPITPITKSGHKIALYVRVSSEEAASNPEGSIKSQEQRLRGYVDLRNAHERFGEIKAVFIDPARSGKDMDRPELRKLLAMIKRREITMVMVSELSRLSRNVRDFLEMWALMEEAGCQFQSLREQVDTSTAPGRLVINCMMSFAQFEREQCGERVTANLQARSLRGLWNGGIVPMGYRTIPDKKGYLEIDPEVSPMIRAGFDGFLSHQSLTKTASWLNEQGHRIPRKMKGGGGRPRLGHFTIDNLHFMLRNKAYAGIKTHRIGDEIKEAKAVWEPIVDAVTFERVQAILTNNHRTRKPIWQERRYPFWLAGLAYCATCGDKLSGKSAHGNGGKIPYYEHAWSTKKQACLVKKVFDCKPNRVLAKKLEPEVWSKIEEVLRNPEIAKALITEAKTNFDKRTQSDDGKRIKEKIAALDSQLEALAERIAALPRTLSAGPFYKQMEKIQDIKKQEEDRLRAVEQDTNDGGMPADLPSYEALITVFGNFIDSPVILENRIKIIQKLIHRIEIRPDTFRLHFHVGKQHIEGELAHAGSPLFLCPKTKRAEPAITSSASYFSSRSKFSCSNTLTNGWGTRIRT